MSHTKEKLDIFSENLLTFEVDQAGSSQTLDSNRAQNSRKRTMTEKGLEYAITIKRKVALSKAQEFKSSLTDFRFSVSTTRSQNELKLELEAKIDQFRAALQAFDECLQLIVDPLQSCSITDAQNELKTTWEGPEGALNFAEECLRALQEEDTRSISSYVTQKSMRSRGSSRSSLSNTKDTLISIKAKKAVLQERLKFTDVIKEQEKTLSKLKLEQELSETLAEEAIYEAEIIEEPIISPMPNLPKDPSTTLRRFLNSEPSSNVLAPQPTQSTTPMYPVQLPYSVPFACPTQSTSEKTLVTAHPSSATTEASLITPDVKDSVLNSTTDYVSDMSAATLTPTTSKSVPLAGFASKPSPIQSMNTWTTFTPFTPRMATSTNVLPNTTYSANTRHVFQDSNDQNPVSLHQHLSQPPLTSNLSPTQHETAKHSEKLIEALTKVTQIQRLPQAKVDVYRGDEKDKTKYFLWEKSFDALIDSAPVTDIQKLHLLYQHLDGRAKRVVEQLQYMIEDPVTAYNEARKLLKERFGHTAFLESDFENKLTNWPKIGSNDAQELQEFGDFLQQVKIASQYIPNLKIFEYPSKLQSLVEKLPLWFRNKWSNKVQKLQMSGHNAFPSFSVFLEEVVFHAERMNIPQLKPSQSSNPNPNASSPPDRKGIRTLASKTTSSEEEIEKKQEEDGESPPKAMDEEKQDVRDEQYCPYHKTKSHSLNQCKKFCELSFEERKNFCLKADYVSTARIQTNTSRRRVTRYLPNVVFVRRST